MTAALATCEHGAAYDPDGWTPCTLPHRGGPVAVVSVAAAPHDELEHELRDEAPAAMPRNLPADFWEAQPGLLHIRQAAHARMQSADAVLGAALARLSAMVDPGLRFDTGLGPGSMNLFVIPVGAASAGKTASVRVAQDLISTPTHLTEPGAFLDGIPVGSGEGLAEAYMGLVTRETGESTGRGKAKTERVREQVRRHVFVYVDEGEQLLKIGDRRGATIGSTIRSAWVCATLGQANASAETTRVLPRDSYALGLVVGFQPDTALPLLSDVGPGTPQRFWWVSALDPSVPDDLPQHPGQLYVSLRDVFAQPRQGLIEAPAAVRQEVQESRRADVRGERTIDPFDAHETLMRSKLAALLAVLDGRDAISDLDWELTREMWAVSRSVRNGLLAAGRRHDERLTSERLRRKVVEAATLDQVPARTLRVARLIARKVVEGGGLTTSGARQALPYRDRELFEAALERAAAEGWVLRSDSGITPGDAP